MSDKIRNPINNKLLDRAQQAASKARKVIDKKNVNSTQITEDEDKQSFIALDRFDNGPDTGGSLVALNKYSGSQYSNVVSAALQRTATIVKLKFNDRIFYNELMVEKARSDVEWGAAVVGMREAYKNFKDQEQNQAWLNDPKNKGKIHPQMKQIARDLGYTDLYGEEFAEIALTRVSELDARKLIQISQQVKQNHQWFASYWTKQLAEDLKSIRESASLAKSGAV